MSRNTKSFTQLVKYLDKEDVLSAQSWNMYANLDSNKQIVREFLENSQHLENARGKLYLYHEVLSLEANNLSLQKQQEILNDLANHYVKSRAKNHLTYAVVHNDTKNMHVHLVMSANEVYGSKRVRLSKREFKNIQASLEEYKNLKYPELEQTKIYQKAKDSSKSNRTEQEIKHKKGKASKKEQIKIELELIFNRSLSQKSLQNSLKAKGYELYQRGKTIGVIFEDKKYRLKTIGLDKTYNSTLKRHERKEARTEKRNEFKHSR